MNWTEVVTNPLGVAAFALFLVFSLLAKRSSNKPSNRLMLLFATMAILTLICGLGIAIFQSRKPIGETRHERRPTSIKQETRGSNSPAITGVGGDVNIINKNPPPSETSE